MKRRHLRPGSLLLAALVCAAAGGLAGDTTSAPDKDGFIRDWLLIGPYPSYKTDAGPPGFGDDLLANQGGELVVEPFAGLSDKATFIADKAKLIAGIGSTNEWGFTDSKTVDIAWKELQWTESTPVISLDDRFGEFKDHLVAYVACYVISPFDRKIQVRLGSDDDYKLWVNHEYIGGETICRGAAPNSTIHVAELRKGVNLLLLKVVDRTNGHAFCLAITDTQGAPCDDLKITTENPKAQRARGCPALGRVDVVDEGGFARLELAGEAPFFPGAQVARVGLGHAPAVVASVELLVTDGKSRPLWGETREAELRPDQPWLVEKPIQCETAGELTLAAVVQEKATGKLLAHLRHKVAILDPLVLREQAGALAKEKADAEARRQALADKLAAKQQELKAQRQAVAMQYTRIEALYAERRAALAKQAGDAGKSVAEPLPPSVDLPRGRLCLNGDTWEIATAQKKGSDYDKERTPAAGWTSTRIPINCLKSYFRSRSLPVQGKGPKPDDKFYGPSETMPCGGDYVLPDARLGDATWFRLRFTLPTEWEKRQLSLILHRAKTHVRVLLNGTFCGEEKNWGGILRFDLRGAKTGENELCVYVANGGTVGLHEVNNPMTYSMHGLMGDVWLQAEPELAVDDTWVLPSFRDAALKARVWIANHGGKQSPATIRAFVVGDNQVRLRLGEKKMIVPAKSVADVGFEHPWSDPRLWGIGGEWGEPYLYQLVTEVDIDGKLVDRHYTRFGFREFWVEGHHFYLNGKRIFLQGDVGFPNANLRHQLQVVLPLLRENQINTIRNHDAVYDAEELPQVADELGMLVYAQMYAFLQPYRLPPKRGDYLGGGVEGGYLSQEEFLAHPLHADNMRNYARWVKMMRNHPSVVILSTDNEIFTQAWDKPEQLAYNLRNDRLGAWYGRYVKSLDPTRLITRDGDEGTWGTPLGKWGEEPPCDTANYHYPDFDIASCARNWETVYGGRPAVFGETLYHSYGAWDGWIGATPPQVAMKAKKCRETMAIYRELEIPGAIYMGLSSDGFIELTGEGTGAWNVTPAMRAEYKDKGVIQSLPRYPYFPITWPSLSGPGFKAEFHVGTATSTGHMVINWFDPDRPTHVPNAVNAAYRETLLPMPPLKKFRAPEVLGRVRKDGQPVAGAMVWLRPADNQPATPVGVRADSRGTAWFILHAPGRYLAKVGAVEQIVDVAESPNDPPRPGFGHLQTVELTMP